MFRMDDDMLYTSYDHDLLQGELDEHMITLEQALGDRTRFFYDYDFGDNWEHDRNLGPHMMPGHRPGTRAAAIDRH